MGYGMRGSGLLRELEGLPVPRCPQVQVKSLPLTSHLLTRASQIPELSLSLKPLPYSSFPVSVR